MDFHSSGRCVVKSRSCTLDGTRPRVQATVRPGDERVPGATTGPTTAPAPANPGTGTTAQGSSTAWLPIGITVGAVMLIASAAIVVVRRRASLLPELTPERAWSRARRRLAKKGVAWSDADTPRTVVASVQAQVRALSGSGLTGEAADALVALARTVESERYARTPPVVDPTVLAGWVDELLSGVDAVLSGPRRDAVPSAPRDGS